MSLHTWEKLQFAADVTDRHAAYRGLDLKSSFYLEQEAAKPILSMFVPPQLQTQDFLLYLELSPRFC